MPASEEITSVPPPELAPVLKLAVALAVDVSDALYPVLPREAGSTPRDHLTAAYMGVCIEHRESIILLVRHGANSSALALVRPAYENCTRGLWVKFAAKDEQLAAMVNAKGYMPKFETVGKELAMASAGRELAKVRGLAWPIMSDFAHGGVRQLRAWISDQEVGPTHDPEQMAQVLLLADIYGWYAAFGQYAAAGMDPAPLHAIFKRQIEPRVLELRDRDAGQRHVDNEQRL